ncbi:MAG: thioredoxin domain-containing protein [Spirochaetaceae bacterium]
MKVFTIISVLIFMTVLPIFGENKKDNGPIIDYKSMEQVMELAETKPTVLFFKANWCSSCLSAAKKFSATKDQFKDINLVVVNYDTSKKLKTKYGVTYQHTFIQVDSNGNSIAEWSGGATKELLANVVQGDM